MTWHLTLFYLTCFYGDEMVTLETQLMYFDLQRHFWKSQCLGNMRHLWPSKAGCSWAGVLGGGDPRRKCSFLSLGLCFVWFLLTRVRNLVFFFPSRQNTQRNHLSLPFFFFSLMAVIIVLAIGSWCSGLPLFSHVATQQKQDGGTTNQHAHAGWVPGHAREGLPLSCLD